MRNRILYLMIVMILIVIITIVINIDIAEHQVIVLEDQKSHVNKKMDLNGHDFVLSYTHSVLLTPADEYFKVSEDGEMILYKTIYESFGVGLPYEQKDDSDFEIKDGKFILYMDRKVPKINMVVSSIPDHVITINNTKYPLVDLVNQETNAISIYVEKTKILTLFGKTIIL